MAATLFLSPPPPLSRPHFPHHCNPISDPYISTSLSLNPNSFRSPKPIPPSKSAKSLSLSSTSNPVPATITANKDDADNNNINGKNRIQNPNPDCSFSSELFSPSDEAIKMPTAPWMKGPFLLHPNQFLDLSKSRKKRNFTNEEEEKPDRSLTEKVSGGRGKKAMKKIFEGIGELKETHVSEETQKNPEDIELDISLGEFGKDENPNFGGKMP